MPKPLDDEAGSRGDKLFRLAVESAVDFAIITTDLEGRITTWNRGAERLFGYSEAEVVGREGSIIFIPEDRAAGIPEAEHEAALTAGRSEDERWHVRKDGSRFFASGVVTPLGEEMPLGFTKVARDITERRLAEEEARRQKELLEVTLASIGDAVITTDAEGRVTYLNEVAERLTGWKTHEARERPLEEPFRIVNESSRLPVENPAKRALETGTVVGLANHTVLIARDGSETPIDDSAAPIRGDDGTVQGVVLVFRDVSERKRAERRLAAQHATARILAEARSASEAAPRILEVVCTNLGWDLGELWTVDERANRLRCIEVWHSPSVDVAEFEDASRGRTFARGEGSPGTVWETGEPLWLANVVDNPNFPRVAMAAKSGLHGAFAVPIALEDKFLGVMEFFSRGVREPDEEMLSMMATIGRQIGQFIERRQAEESCRENEALKGAILASALDCIITIDDEDRVIEWNPAAERTFGYGRSEVIGRRMGELIVPPELRERHYRGMAHYLKTGEGPVLGKRIEITALRKGGATFPVELAITPIVLGARRVFTAYLRDIAARKRAEEELREAQTRLDAALEAGTIGTWTWDVARDRITGDRNLAGMYALPPEEVAEGVPLARFLPAIHPDDHERVGAVVARALEHGERYEADTRLVSPDGTIRWVEARGRIDRDASGRATLVTGVTVDITELKEADRRNTTILESITDGFLAMDAEFRHTYANEMCERLTNIKREELLGRTHWEVFPATVGTQVEANYRRAAQERVTIEFENFYEPFRRWYSIKASPSRDGGILVYFQDVTERKQAGEALVESEAKFRTLAETIPQLAWMARPDGHIFWYNRRWYEYTGTTPEEMEGWGWQSVHDPETLPHVVERWTGSIETGEPFDMVFPLKGADGGFRPFLTRVMPLRGEAGRVLGWFGTNTDISEQRRMEEELRENDRRKDQFLAMLAHELRNPLSSIGNAATLLKMTTSEEHREWARDVVERQTKHVSRLVDDLLDVSRITRGLVTLKKENIDPAPVLDAAVEVARPLIEERKHKLYVSYRPGALRVDADPTRLEQIMVNLLTNAAKYTDNGGEIRLSAEKGGDDVVITVSDNGIGISPTMLPKMFELFAQGDRTLARSEGGLGIGLTLVRTLTEMHGGSVVAKSGGPDAGSTFTVRLPAAPTPKPERSSDERSATGKAGRGFRVLVVDDNTDTARAMGRILKLLGNDVRVAHDGYEAIEAAIEHDPDFVLLDIGLPGMDGYEVARRLRQEECCRDAVLIAITGYGQDEDKRRSKEAGFDHHLTKPIDHNALITLLSTGLNAGG